jgi:Ca-activated chloride channel family protein
MRFTGILIALLFGYGTTANADWADLWRTPEQRAADAFEAGDHEALLSNAPDSNWTGLGQFQAGDFETASKTFSEQAINEQLNNDSEAVNRALYNQGVSDVMAGRYKEALSNFDTVLSDDPGFVDAAHNRELTQKLIQQQQQQQQQGDQGEQDDQSQKDGDQQQDQENQQESQDGQQSGESSQSDQQSEGQQDSEQNSEQSAGSEGDKEDDSDSESETDAQQAAMDAAKALAAEAQQGEVQKGTDPRQSENMEAAVEERPLTESEQATEQWLRQIPDDPAGLLRRKLEQSHRNEFPEVRDAVKPW